MARHDDDDDDAYGPDGILKDGRRLRVSMMMRDGGDDGLTDVQRSVRDATSPLRVVDGFGNSGLALQRPGPRFSTDAAALDAKEAAYRQMCADMDYRTAPKPAADPPASPSPRGQQPGDICTINGAPGHLNHRLECVPDRQDARPVYDAVEAQRIKDEAYAEMVAAMDYRTAPKPPAEPADLTTAWSRRR